MAKSNLASLFLCLLLTGCTAASQTKSSDDGDYLTQTKIAILNLLPSCGLRQIEIPNAAIDYNDPINGFKTLLASSRLISTELVFFKDSAGKIPLDRPAKGLEFKNPKGDKFYACHSEGKEFSEIRGYEDVIGPYLPSGEFCFSPNSEQSTENVSRLRKCEERIDQISNLGFWIVVRQGENKESILKEARTLARENLKYGYADYPVTLVGNLAITFVANFDAVNSATISNIDLIWDTLNTKLFGRQLGKILEDYPTDFNRDSDQNHKESNDGREAVVNFLKRNQEWLACKNDLNISETNFAIGDCGILEFEVFQADLRTGSCSFLGYWTDKLGNSRIGIVEFCSTYSEGVFAENSVHKIKVRVNGTTSYLTRLGYMNEVVSFTTTR